MTRRNTSCHSLYTMLNSNSAWIFFQSSTCNDSHDSWIRTRGQACESSHWHYGNKDQDEQQTYRVNRRMITWITLFQCNSNRHRVKSHFYGSKWDTDHTRIPDLFGFFVAVVAAESDCSCHVLDEQRNERVVVSLVNLYSCLKDATCEIYFLSSLQLITYKKSPGLTSEWLNSRTF